MEEQRFYPSATKTAFLYKSAIDDLFLVFGFKEKIKIIHHIRLRIGAEYSAPAP